MSHKRYTKFPSSSADGNNTQLWKQPALNRPCTLFPTTSLDLGLALQEAESVKERPSQPVQPENPQLKPRIIEQRSVRPLVLPLLVDAKSPSATIETVEIDIQCKHEDPNLYYQSFHRREIGGTAFIAHRKSTSPETVLIKRCAEKINVKAAITKLKHRNILEVVDLFSFNNSFFIVYEYSQWEIQLADVNAISKPLREIHIAAICVEVLRGVRYLNTMLSRGHGGINAKSVLISVKAEIKLANIVDCMLISSDAKDVELEDAKALGYLLVYLMETGTSLQNPRTLNLVYPENWSPESLNFLRSTAFADCETLQQSKFLQNSPGPVCLLPYVHTAILAKETDWAYCDEIPTT